MLASELSSLSLKYIARDFLKSATHDHEGFSRIDGDMQVQSGGPTLLPKRDCRRQSFAY
jgi:hypothetical protein